jgi:hypothetical protein
MENIVTNNVGIEVNKTFKATIGKKIITHIIDGLFVLILGIALFFVVCYPILNNSSYVTFKEDKKENCDVMLTILNESKLAVYNDKTNALSTDESMYKVFILQQIKYCYEIYPDEYKKDLDDDGYLSYVEKMEDVKVDSYDNNCLGYFYTEFIIGKLDKNNEVIVEYTKEESKEYFLTQVIDCDKAGKDIFKCDDKNSLPRLTVDTCRYAFEYYVKGANYSTLRDLDSKFYNYFISLYKDAGDLLLRYSKYETSFNNYEQLYSLINNINLLCIFLSFTISFVILMVLVPLLNKRRQTFSSMIFKVMYFDKKMNCNLCKTLINSGLYYVLFFFVTFFMSLIFGNQLFNYTFLTIGLLTLKLIHLCGISLIISLISIFVLAISKSKNSLVEMITKTDLYDITIS